MTETQIQYICDLGYGNNTRQKMLDVIIKESGINQFLIIKKDGTFSEIPREVLYNTCIAMVQDTCFYIDREKGLSKLTLPFEHKMRDKVTKEEKMAAIAYAENHGIKMPVNLRSLFYEWPEIIQYMSPCKDMFPGKKEKECFAYALSDVINNHKDAFLRKSSLSEKDFCDEVIRKYNKKILNCMAFSENIRNYPENSPIHRLVTHAFSLIWNAEKFKPKESWIKKNVTPSMNEADFKLFKVVTSIKKPLYEKSPDNKKWRTFDTIRVWFSLVSKDIMPDRNVFIKENRKGFAKLALACTQDDQRCEIPVNLLKIDHIGITSQSQLEFIFSLKDEVKTAFEN